MNQRYENYERIAKQKEGQRQIFVLAGIISVAILVSFLSEVIFHREIGQYVAPVILIIGYLYLQSSKVTNKKKAMINKIVEERKAIKKQLSDLEEEREFLMSDVAIEKLDPDDRKEKLRMINYSIKQLALDEKEYIELEKENRKELREM